MYVREFLQLIMQEAFNPGTNVSRSSLNNELVLHLRSLESLEVTSGKSAAILSPLDVFIEGFFTWMTI